jgi:hypothetical protein
MNRYESFFWNIFGWESVLFGIHRKAFANKDLWPIGK